jgi:AcrR family transcriptional regulator
MAKTPQHEQTRALILAGAGRSFRSHGYGGAGVDGLAKAAGMTSGAFYAHFKSKAEAFRESVRSGLLELEQANEQLRNDEPKTWLGTFVDFYLGQKRTCALTDSCALQSLTPEVARADDETRKTFEDQLRAVIDATADGLPAPSAAARRQQAIVTLVLLSGGVSLARAVSDPALSEEIARAVRSSLLGTPKPRAGAKRKPSEPKR